MELVWRCTYGEEFQKTDGKWPGHVADERIPVEALAFGTDAIYKALQRFGE